MKGILNHIALLLCFLFCCATTTTAQDNKKYDRELTYAQMWKEILTCEEPEYTLEHSLILEKENDDLIIDSLQKKYPYVSAKVKIRKCTFVGFAEDHQGSFSVDIHTSNLTFERNFLIYENEGLSLFFIDKTNFLSGVTIQRNGSLFDNLFFTDCTINGYFRLGSNDNDNDDIGIDFWRCQINLERNEFQKKHQMESRSFFAFSSESSSLSINQSKFTGDSSISLIGVYGKSIEFIQIDSCIFDVDLDFGGCKIVDRIDIHASKFLEVDLYGVVLPPISKANIRFNQLTKNLSLFDEKERKIEREKNVPIYVYERILYKGATYEEQKKLKLYDELMALYSKFFKLYRERGDLESANGCYVAMKQLQTARLKYLYDENNTVENWMYWQLNVFLEYFCDYLTSPVKALIISMWTILKFALLYFFFYSSWDQINRKFLIRQHRKLMLYFSSEQRLEDFYTEEYKIETQDYEAYKKELEERRVFVPFFINFFGKPLYNMSLLRYKVMSWVYRRAEILSGRWVDLKSLKKFTVGTKVFVALIFYIAYLITVRAANSIILSINAFSTLGFGNIPVHGVLRYFTILEGFLGWFLLSIFSVSLISQILQT
ncbi:MAG: hypothetical protein MK207_08000 [Saprospiraceae bacterium]|nr:hypothetical protein [Saprospiraceae bacterium]